MTESKDTMKTRDRRAFLRALPLAAAGLFCKSGISSAQSYSGNSDFVVDGPCGGDDTPAINGAIAEAKANGGGNLHFRQGVWRHTGIWIDSSNIRLKGDFCGGWLFQDEPNGTRLLYTGAEGGVAVRIEPPTDGSANFMWGSGVQDMQILAGNGLASVGLLVGSVQRYAMENLYVGGLPSSIGVYVCATQTPSVTYNMHSEWRQIDVVVDGAANAMVLDGVPGSSDIGGRSCGFLNFYGLQLTHQNGCALAVLSADDCTFHGSSSSMIEGGTGTSIYLGGTSDGTLKQALCNWFFGWHGNAPIVCQGGTSPSRGNKLYVTDVDTVMDFVQLGNAQNYIESMGGQTSPAYTNGPSAPTAPAAKPVKKKK